ncbi:unnamed protein product, partial [Allacma fusca]
MSGQRTGYVDAGARLDLTNFHEYSRSQGGSMISYKYRHELNTPDIESTFSDVEPAIKKLLNELYAIHTLSKVEISLGIQMEKEIVQESGQIGFKQALIYFKSSHYELQTPESIDSILLKSASDIVEKKNTFLDNGSSWYIVKIDSLEVKIGDVNVISKGTEKFVQLEIPARDLFVPVLNCNYNMAHHQTKGWQGNRRVKLRFIDSCQFLPGKLSSLAEALKKENASTLNLVHESIPYILGGSSKRMQKRHKHETKDSAQLLFEKLPYPYRYLSSPDVLIDGHPIPSQSHFDNDLANEKCTDEEWLVVQNVIRTFNIHDFRNFTRLYTMNDVILLAVIWENFRKNGLEMYGLDPTYMCTGSGYSFQCFLYKTRAEIEYIRDAKMLKWLSSGIRGGTSFCTIKMHTANNERCPNGYDPSKERTHIIYNDKVSLYATALLDKYPQSNFNWEDVKILESIDWRTFESIDDTGYFLEVDLGYPHDVQDTTSDLPLAPEKRIITFEELSDKQKCIMTNLKRSTQ